MEPRDHVSTVSVFNDHINNQDITSLAQLMSENHVFIDSSDDVHEGEENHRSLNLPQRTCCDLPKIASCSFPIRVVKRH